MSTTAEQTPDVIEVTRNGSILYRCPGCKFYHGLTTQRRIAGPEGPVWQWNGNKRTPTITPEVLYSGTPRCRHTVQDGYITFARDCEHSLAGQTVPMNPVTK